MTLQNKLREYILLAGLLLKRLVCILTSIFIVSPSSITCYAALYIMSIP